MCRDCRVTGGRRRPCWPHPVDGNPHGYPCPRREWPDSDAADLASLAGLGAHGETGHLFSEMWGAMFGERRPEDRARLLSRLLLAYSDEAIASVYFPKVS